MKTSKLRLEVLPKMNTLPAFWSGGFTTLGLSFSSVPVIDAGVDRSVFLGAKTYLAGNVTWLEIRRKIRHGGSKILDRESLSFMTRLTCHQS